MLHSNETSLNFQTRLKSLVALSLELASSASLDDLCRLTVEKGRSRLGFDRLGLWFFESDTGMMRGSYGTDEFGQIRDERDASIVVDAHSRMNSVLTSPDAVMVHQHVPLYDGQSRVIGHGWNVIAVLRDGEESIGWLSADNLMNKKPLAPYEPELLALYGATIGHLVNRFRAQEALRRREEEDARFQAKLRRLHEVTIELSQVTEFDDLCRRAVELGRTHLGFDRLGLWFFDTDPAFLIGSYGTDETGSIRDERHRLQRIPASFRERREMLKGSVLISASTETPLLDDNAEIIGFGWNAIAQVWDGDRSIGWLSTDNLLSHQPLNEFHLEMLALYASTIGHLTRTLKAHEALAKERNLLRTIIDTVPDYIFLKDRDARFVLVNQAAWRAIEGLQSEDDLIGKNDFDLFPPETAALFYADDRRVLDEGHSILNHEENGTYRGSTLPRSLLTTKAPLFDSTGSIIGLVGVTRDITGYKTIERQALMTEVERARFTILQEFITSITHDLRTPLANINTSLYIVGRTTDAAKKAAHLDSIKNQVAHLDHIIQDILTIRRLDSTQEMASVPVKLNMLAETIQENMEESFRQKNITFQLSLAENLPDMHGDGQELYPAMLHLVHNALQYTPPEGTVTLRTYTQENQVIFEVQDTGIGISDTELPLIFERFYRADKARSMEKGGSGLGLAIVRKIVEMHGGTIEVNSTAGQGSTFRMALPLQIQK
jgi:PAS domain S-box-containing protein